MNESSTRKSLENVLRPAIASASETTDVLAVGFDTHHLDALVAVLSGLETPPRVCVLTDGNVLKHLRGRFAVASRAAGLVEADRLALRTPASGDTLSLERNLLLTGGRALVVLATTGTAGTLRNDGTDDDAAFVEALYERFERAFEAGETFDLRTPGRTRISETLTEEFGPDVEATFSELVRDMVVPERTDADEGVYEPAQAAVLAAATHGELLYDISNWGENVGLASKATFSRMKRTLEDEGLIDTEKVPIDVGRPRLRLVRTDRALAA